MSDLKKLLNSFKTDEELKAYIEAQQHSFIEMSKKMKALEDLNANLTRQIGELTTELQWGKASELDTTNISNSELICLTEIGKLKITTSERPLTLEEAKKLDLYVKVLQIMTSKKSKQDEFKDFDTEKLLKIVQNEE